MRSVFRTRILLFLQAAVITAATWFVFAPVFHGQWQWDDDVEVTSNLALRDRAGLWSIWFAPNTPDYFPVKTTLQWVQWHLWHDNVTGYHLTNVALHLLSAFLLWHLLRKLGLKLAWIGGLFFAIHPLVVESVAWISEFKNVLSLPLLIGAMSAYQEWKGEGGRGEAGGRRRWYVLSLGLFVVAMLSKSTVVMFPVVLLLYAWWRRGRVTRGDLLASAPFFAVSLVLGLVTVWFQSHRAIAGEVILTGGFSVRVAAAGLALAFYLSKSLFPVGLVPIYRRWAVEPLSFPEFLPWLVIGVILFCCWKNRATWGRHALLGLGWFLINLVPVLGFVPMSYLRLAWVADHFVYLSLAGFAGLATALIGKAVAGKVESEKWKVKTFGVGLWVGVAIVVAGLAVESRWYAGKFINPETLWTYNLRRNPEAWAAKNNLANALLDEGRMPEAVGLYEQALRMQPNYAEVHNNLGNIFAQTGRAEEAIAHYREALRIRPDYSQAHNGLGNLLSQTGRPYEAIVEFDLALKFNPMNAGAHNNFGNTLIGLGRYAEAELHLREAIRIKSDYPEAWSNLGNVFIRTGRTGEAVAAYNRALRFRPDFPEAHNNLGNALVIMGRLAEAVPQFKRAIELQPSYAGAHYNLGLVLAGTGHVSDAIAEFNLALKFRPDFPQARAERDRCLGSQAGPAAR